MEVKYINKKHNDKFLKEGIFLNGISDNDAFFLNSTDEEKLDVKFYNSEIIEEIKKYTPIQIIEYFNKIRFYVDNDYKFVDEIELNLVCIETYAWREYSIPYIVFELNFDFENWSNPFSIPDFAKTIEKVSLLNNRKFDFLDESPLNGISIISELESNDVVFGKIIEEELKVLDIIFKETEKELFNILNNSQSLNVFFMFPEEIKVACEQYLLYFIQFLSDLGIRASSEIKHEAEKTLFSVIPDDKELAINTLYKTLEVYLMSVKEDKINLHFESSNNVAVQQLQSNIYFLKSQLVLANATIEQKNATIKVLEVNPIDNTKNKSNNSEKILGGIIEVDSYTSKNGFKVNWAELVRKLKR